MKKNLLMPAPVVRATDLMLDPFAKIQVSSRLYAVQLILGGQLFNNNKGASRRIRLRMVTTTFFINQKYRLPFANTTHSFIALSLSLFYGQKSVAKIHPACTFLIGIEHRQGWENRKITFWRRKINSWLISLLFYILFSLALTVKCKPLKLPFLLYSNRGNTTHSSFSLNNVFFFFRWAPHFAYP